MADATFSLSSLALGLKPFLAENYPTTLRKIAIHNYASIVYEGSE